MSDVKTGVMPKLSGLNSVPLCLYHSVRSNCSLSAYRGIISTNKCPYSVHKQSVTSDHTMQRKSVIEPHDSILQIASRESL